MIFGFPGDARGSHIVVGGAIMPSITAVVLNGTANRRLGAIT